MDGKRNDGLEGAASGTKVVDVGFVGLGAFLGRLGRGGNTAEGVGGRHVLVLGFFKVGDDAANAVEEPHTVAGSLLGGKIGGVLNTALDGWAALAFDNHKEGVLGTLEFDALFVELRNLRLSHQSAHFFTDSDLFGVSRRFFSGRTVAEWWYDRRQVGCRKRDPAQRWVEDLEDSG